MKDKRAALEREIKTNEAEKHLCWGGKKLSQGTQDKNTRNTKLDS